jgi:stearoyl-CoA desaturase (delta-9 desaturase)
MALELTGAPRTALAPDHGVQKLDNTARIVTTLIVGIPFIALIVGVFRLWGHGIRLRDLLLALTFYFATGHGVTVGYHRLLAHRSFSASRPLKLGLIALGSMAYEGAPIGWVSNHRRHHVTSDTIDDPHSPHHHGTGAAGALRGLWHAHVGWLFTYGGTTSPATNVADMHADRDIVVMNALFPVWCVVSFALPFGLGWILGGTFGAALSALFWAGLVRVAVLHHVTWSVNSLCHMFGRRPFTTKDHSRNVAVLAIVSMGESWHNGHHAFPRSARHGLLRGQFDTSALLIRAFEALGWARYVHRPTGEMVRNRVMTNSRRFGRVTSKAHVSGFVLEGQPVRESAGAIEVVGETHDDLRDRPAALDG